VRPRTIWTIYRKEILDTLRDRRTLLMMLGVPILLYPLIIIGATKFAESSAATANERASSVVVWGDMPRTLVEQLGKETKLKIRSGEGAPAELPPAPPPPPDEEDEKKKPRDVPESAAVQAARKIILNRDVDAVLVLWPGFRAKTEAGGNGKASILYDSVRPDSRKARQRLARSLTAYRKEVLKLRETGRDLPDGYTSALEVRADDIAPQSRRGAMLLGAILPMLLILMSAMSGFYCAIDLTAGEKERGTMQTLLCAPISADEIIAGKFLAVWTVAFLAAFANISSMGLTMTNITFQFVGEIKMTAQAFGISLIALLPISFMLSAIWLAVAAFAKDFKEGQNFLTPVMICLQLPLIVISNPTVELNAYTMFVPVMNIGLLLKSLFLGEAKPDAVFLVMLASCSYAMLAILFAAKVFNRENVLIGGKESVKSIFQMRPQPGATPSPTLALVMFAVVLVLNFYAQPILAAKAGLVTLLLVVMYALFLLPPVATALGLRFDARKTFSLRLPGPMALVASIVAGLTAWTFAAGILVRILPPPPSLSKAIMKALMIEDLHVSLALILFLGAVSPAICEEALFRGFIQSGLGKAGKWPAIAGTALLFGLAHSSIYRLMPAMFLGLVIGYAAWKTGSIVPGMIIHFLNNGLAILLARSKFLAVVLPADQVQFLPWSWTVGGTAMLALAVWQLARKPQK
jgi:sodium transport system permease protein